MCIRDSYYFLGARIRYLPHTFYSIVIFSHLNHDRTPVSYTHLELPDAYKSIHESLSQAAIYHDRKLVLDVCHSEQINDSNVADVLKGADGVVIAPGFGQRGIEGKFVAIRYAREQNLPTFGICLGMQCMVIEYARSVMNLPGANSTEMNPKTEDPIIDFMEHQKAITSMGASMRLGEYDLSLIHIYIEVCDLVVRAIYIHN